MKKFIYLATTFVTIFSMSAFGLVLPTAANAAPLSDGLLAYWNLDEGTGTTAIEPVNSLNGTLQGNTGWNSSSLVVGSTYNAVFDGDGDYVSVADNDELDLAGELTISFWFQLAGNSADNDWPRAVSKGQSTGTDGAYGVFIKDVTGPTDIGLRFIDQANAPHDIRNQTLTNYNDQQWHHVAAAYSNSGDVGKLYLDGIEVKSVAIAGDVAIRATDDDLTIGSARGDAERNFNGGIDEVRIYNRALNANEVAALHDYSNFSVSLDPETATNTINTEHTVTTAVSPALNYIPVLFEGSGTSYTGPNGLPYLYTDGNGQVAASYTGTVVSTDNYTACIDTDKNGACNILTEPTEPYDTASKTWTDLTPPPTPAPTDKNQCKKNGWKTFTSPTFKNQGQCVSYVNGRAANHGQYVKSQTDKKTAAKSIIGMPAKSNKGHTK